MTELPGETAIGRVELAVADASTVVPFYTDVVGLRVVDEGSYRVDLGVGEDTLVRLHEDANVPPRPPRAAGLFHLALRVPDRTDLARAARRLRDADRLTGASDHLVSEALYTADPEGNGVEVYHDRPRSNWERTADGGIRLVTWPLNLEGLDSIVSEGTGPLPSGTTVGHVHLEVTDLQGAESFYVDTVGFDATYRTAGAAFVSAGGYHHHLGLNIWNGRTERASGRGLERFQVVLPDGSTLDRFVDRLEEHPRRIEDAEAGFALRDPDGIEIVVTADE